MAIISLLPNRAAADPQRRLIDAVQAAFAAMPEADQQRCADVYLDMITAGVKTARKEPGN